MNSLTARGLRLMRTGSVVVALSATPSIGAAQCTGDPLAIAGSTALACVDTDGNGVLDPAVDCCLTGFAELQPPDPMDPTGPQLADLCFLAQQGTSPTKLLGCQGDEYSGDGRLEQVEGAASVDLDSELGAFEVFALGTVGIPVTVMSAEVLRGMSVIGSGELMSDPVSPILRVRDAEMVDLVFGFAPLRSMGRDWMCASIPFPVLNGMIDVQMFDLCLPVDAAGEATATLADDPGTQFIRIVFGTGRLSSVPTLGRVGLSAVLVILLMIGALAMRRTARSLPLL